jgi:hypothetical protein
MAADWPSSSPRPAWERQRTQQAGPTSGLRWGAFVRLRIFQKRTRVFSLSSIAARHYYRRLTLCIKDPRILQLHHGAVHIVPVHDGTAWPASPGHAGPLEDRNDVLISRCKLSEQRA